MRTVTLILIFALQIPATPAGRQFSAWLNAFNSGDRGLLQEFFDKSMPDLWQLRGGPENM